MPPMLKIILPNPKGGYCAVVPFVTKTKPGVWHIYVREFLQLISAGLPPLQSKHIRHLRATGLSVSIIRLCLGYIQ